MKEIIFSRPGNLGEVISSSRLINYLHVETHYLYLIITLR